MQKNPKENKEWAIQTLRKHCVQDTKRRQKKTTYKNIKINSTDHTKTPEVIACAR